MDECLDLAAGLPNGAYYVKATQPERAWDEEHIDTINVLEAVINGFVGLGVPLKTLLDEGAGEQTQPVRFKRPWDEADRRRAEAREEERAKAAMRAGEYIRNTKWEAV